MYIPLYQKYFLYINLIDQRYDSLMQSEVLKY